MTTRSILTRCATAAAIAGASLSAAANPLLTQNSFANAGAATTITTAGGPNNGTHQAGEFSGVFGADAFLSYCVDLAQFFSWGVHYADYTPTSGVAAFGAMKALQIGELLTAAGGFALSTPSRSAALQAGLWEILYESESTLALGSGHFTATGGSTAAADIAAVNGFLGHLGDYAPMAYTLYASPSSQDFITAGATRFGPLAVPEPSSTALVALGLGGALFAGRRRRG